VSASAHRRLDDIISDDEGTAEGGHAEVEGNGQAAEDDQEDTADDAQSDAEDERINK